MIGDRLPLLPMIPLRFPCLHRSLQRSKFFVDARCEGDHCHSFPFLHPSSVFLLLKQVSCKCFLFLSLFGRSFQGNQFLLWPLVLVPGSHWSAGNREHKRLQSWVLNVGGERWWEPVQPENHSQFHMCLSVGTSR